MQVSDIQPDSLDPLDLRLIAALQVSPRAGWGEIGGVLGEEERTVSRRMHRLLGSGAVRVTAIYDELLCGWCAPVHLRVRVEPGAVEETGQVLAGRPDTRGVLAVTGSEDVFCELVAPSRDRLHDILATEIPTAKGVRDVRTQVVLRNFQTVAQWYAPYLTAEEVRGLRGDPLDMEPGHTGLSSDERRLADLLVADGRVRFTTIAERFDITPVTARRRLTALLRRGVLQLRAEAEPALLGLDVEAQIALSVRPDASESVGARLAAHPGVRYCAATAGAYAMVIQVCLPNEAELYRFISVDLGAIEGVTDLNVSLITRAYKRGYLRKSGLATLEHA